MSLKHEDDKVVVFERAGCLFVFNFHPTKSFVDYTVGVQDGGAWKIILNSDENRFGGFDRIDSSVLAHASEGGFYGRSHSVKVIFQFEILRLLTSCVFQLYIPSRTCLCLANRDA